MSHLPPRGKGFSLQEGLRLMKECPACRGHYTEAGVRVIEEEDGASLVHLSCLLCGQAVLAVILFSALGMSTLGVLTDLTARDVSRVRRKEPISHDDILSLHTALRESGSFEAALLPPSFISKLIHN